MMNMLMTLVINMVMMFFMSVDEYVDKYIFSSLHLEGDEYIDDIVSSQHVG